jgi:hypothetical protein
MLELSRRFALSTASQDNQPPATNPVYKSTVIILKLLGPFEPSIRKHGAFLGLHRHADLGRAFYLTINT